MFTLINLVIRINMLKDYMYSFLCCTKQEWKRFYSLFFLLQIVNWTYTTLLAVKICVNGMDNFSFKTSKIVIPTALCRDPSTRHLDG